MPTAIDLRPYAGTWVAQDEHDEVIESAPTLDELEAKLLRAGFSEDKLPAIIRIPETGSDSLLL